MTPRKKAFLLLEDIIINTRYSNLALKAQLSERYSKEDRAFITSLVYGTLDKLINIDYIIDQFAKGRVQLKVRNILRIGVYQILYMDKVPDYSACDESVELAKDAGKGALTGFINGVLRNIIRSKDNIKYPDKSIDPAAYLSAKYSFPKELVKELIEDYGFAESEALLSYEPEYNSAVRINTEVISVEEFLHALDSRQISYSKGKFFDDLVYLKGNGIFDTELFTLGKCSIQGEASMMAVQALEPKKGQRVLDACAAPGGKTVYIAQLIEAGQVVALDRHAHRVELIIANATRCGCERLINAICADSSEFLSGLGEFDRVLVDAPCSGLGVLGAKPEIKNTINIETLKELEMLQSKILQTAAQYCKKDGILVYSTCTFRKNENQKIVDEFLKNNKQFSLDSLEGHLSSALANHDLSSGLIQLMPNIDGVDGFFIARMRRNA